MTKVYAGVSLEVLRPFGRDGKVVNEDACQVVGAPKFSLPLPLTPLHPQHEWIENGAFKALELGYLDKLIFNVLDLHPDNAQAKVLESYTFKTGTRSEVSLGAGKRDLTATIGSQVVTKEDVQDTMQKLIKTLVMLTSSLQQLPDTRWLSVSIVYNAMAPQGYEAPQFSPQDPSKEPAFDHDPLVIPMGEVGTGHQTLGLEFRQVDWDAAAAAAATASESDGTERQWEMEKEELIQQAHSIVHNAERRGVSAEVALKSSKLAESIPNQVLNDILSKMTTLQLVKQPPPPKQTYGRVKRPLQQLQTCSNQVDDGKKTRLADNFL